MTLGDGSSAQRSLSQLPHDLVVDRVYLHGDASKGQKRGIALNSASTTITGSYVAHIKAVGQDSRWRRLREISWRQHVMDTTSVRTSTSRLAELGLARLPHCLRASSRWRWTVALPAA